MEPVQWEKEVTPLLAYDDVPSFGKFSDMFSATVTVPYDPVVKMLTGEVQKISVRPEVPLFLFSPRTRVYRAEDCADFRGQLSKFEPCERVTEDGPEAEVTVTAV